VRATSDCFYYRRVFVPFNPRGLFACAAQRILNSQPDKSK